MNTKLIQLKKDIKLLVDNTMTYKVVRETFSKYDIESLELTLSAERSCCHASLKNVSDILLAADRRTSLANVDGMSAASAREIYDVLGANWKELCNKMKPTSGTL